MSAETREESSSSGARVARNSARFSRAIIRFLVPGLSVLLATGCASGGKATVSAPPAGAPRTVPPASASEAFVAELPVASPEGRRVLLTLGADGAAALARNGSRGAPPRVDSGTWKETGRERLNVEFAARADGLHAPAPLVLNRDGLTLTARDWSRDEWGPGGLTLKLFPLIGVWKQDPGSLTLEFHPDGRLTGVADGIDVVGRWSATPARALTIALDARTRPEASPESPAHRTLARLGTVASYGQQGGRMTLEGTAGGGALEFTRVR